MVLQLNKDNYEQEVMKAEGTGIRGLFHSLVQGLAECRHPYCRRRERTSSSASSMSMMLHLSQSSSESAPFLPSW